MFSHASLVSSSTEGKTQNMGKKKSVVLHIESQCMHLNKALQVIGHSHIASDTVLPLVYCSECHSNDRSLRKFNLHWNCNCYSQDKVVPTSLCCKTLCWRRQICPLFPLTMKLTMQFYQEEKKKKIEGMTNSPETNPGGGFCFCLCYKRI